VLTTLADNSPLKAFLSKRANLSLDGSNPRTTCDRVTGENKENSFPGRERQKKTGRRELGFGDDMYTGGGCGGT